MSNEIPDQAKNQILPNSWPPAPTSAPTNAAAAAGETELTHCPHCRHRLLTVRSVLCNWCGAPINDEKYLARAAAERAAADEAERRKIQVETEQVAKFGIIGRLRRKAKGKL